MSKNNNYTNEKTIVFLQKKLRFYFDEIYCLKNLVSQDFDVEYLHDYRINIRKSRVILSEFDGIFPLKKSKTLNKFLKKNTRLTNKIRDLDVLISNSEKCKLFLPPEKQNYLDKFFNDLKIRQKSELYRYIKFIKSKDFNNNLAIFKNLISLESKKPVNVNSFKPIGSNLSKCVKTLYKNIRKLGCFIVINKSYSDLHTYRISVKKLRYILEIFNIFFNEIQLMQFLSKLKKIQSILGCYNDFQNQIKIIKKYISENRNSYSEENILIIESLKLHLLERKKQKLDEFFVEYEQFNNEFIKKELSSILTLKLN